MSACTFFGHRDCPDSILPALRSVLIELITDKNVHTFFVGNHGHFDSLVLNTLRELKQLYPHITYSVVLAYLPKEKDELICHNTIFPEGIESIHPRYSITWRNKWMLNESSFVVTYINRSFGGAFNFYSSAIRKKKNVINLAELNN